MSTGRDSHIRTDLWFFSGCHYWNKLSLCLFMLKPSLKGTVHQKKENYLNHNFHFMLKSHTWNNERKGKWSQEFHFWVHYPFKRDCSHKNAVLLSKNVRCHTIVSNCRAATLMNERKARSWDVRTGETHRNCQSFSSYLHRKTKSGEAEHKKAFRVNQPLDFKQTAVRKYNDRHHTGECQTRQNMNKQD